MAQVNFITNDPKAVGGVALKQISPPTQPPASAARILVTPAAAAGLFPIHTPEFDFWQTQSSLIRGLNAWKSLTGAFLPRWFGNRRVLPVFSNAGDDLNAFYDRDSLQFFHHTFQGRTVHSCESEDVAVHELGHALLDALRPDLFDVPFIEAGALHESFGDCWALLTGLHDVDVRTRVLQASPDLGSHQFLDRLAEELGDAIRREFGAAGVEPGALRRALNTFKWADPLTLPASAPASRLSREVHNFSRVFTGALYDTLRNVFATQPQTAAGLLAATRTTGKLLLAAVRTVPASPRLFEGVGRRMLQADVGSNSGANVTSIRSAFSQHGITLAAPAQSLAVPMASKRAGAAMGQIRNALGVSSRGKLQLTAVSSDMHANLAHVTAVQPLALSGAGLKGLSILVPAVARVATRGRAVVAMVGEARPVSDEENQHAQAFAEGLVSGGEVPVAARRARAVSTVYAPIGRPSTHAIKTVNGVKTIVRVGFACSGRCCC